MRKIGFLAGLPRSGSTLLGALLSQREDFHVSATSNLIDTMGAAATAWENSPQVKTGDVALEAIFPILRSMYETHYRDFDGCVLDKSRGWAAPKIMDTMAKVMVAPPKIIATVRPIAECLASFVKIAKFKGDIQEFARTSPLAHHLFQSYHTLKEGFEKSPDNFLFIEYADLVSDPQEQCDRVSDFYGLPLFTHTLTGLSNPVPEHDAETWNVPGLHDVRPVISRVRYSAKTILGKKLFNFYQGGEFWTNKPKPPRKKHILDLQLEASLRGDFEAGWRFNQMADQDDDRVSFNRGWYLLRHGKLKEGMASLAAGRRINVFGSPSPSSQPMYEGQALNGEPVLLHSEGGLGDNICNARFAKDVAARGGKVILSCQPSLASILCKIDGVSAVVQSEAAGGVYHKFWVPAMSAPLMLGLEYEDLDGSPYLPCPKLQTNKRLRVGLRWSGNPKFEHEQHRKFDPSPLFELDADLVSLQDTSEVPIPDYIMQPKLDGWEKTTSEIAKCDLVVSSCTAVAHLSAAMGKPTWIIVPIMSYYPWALPGDASPWYRAVRLFRQEKYGEWDVPLNRVADELVQLQAVSSEKIRSGHGC